MLVARGLGSPGGLLVSNGLGTVTATVIPPAEHEFIFRVDLQLTLEYIRDVCLRIAVPVRQAFIKISTGAGYGISN